MIRGYRNFNSVSSSGYHYQSRRFWNVSKFFGSKEPKCDGSEVVDVKSGNDGVVSTTVTLGSRKQTFQVGKLANLASGSVLSRAGDSVLLTTAVSEKVAQNGKDFMPLMVDYREKYYAAGYIPQTAHRREMASDAEILKSRIIDRSIRPLFPSDYFNETQIISTVQAYDDDNDPVVLAVNSASAALSVSDIPWNGPIGCVRIGEVDGKFIINPTMQERNKSTLDLLYSGTKDRTLMIESECMQLGDTKVIEALKFAHKAVKDIVIAQEELARQTGKPKRSFQSCDISEDVEKAAISAGYDEARELYANSSITKQEREEGEQTLTRKIISHLSENFGSVTSLSKQIVAHKVLQHAFRDHSLEKQRCDGRLDKQIRPLQIETDVLPVVHGSSIFGRGDTQALCTVTLGPLDDGQVVRSATNGKGIKHAMLHYEFPPYCVNETGRIGGVNRRMVGHGALAEKAITPIIPSTEKFPYAIRMTSEITGSDGSSSMATVCGVNMALMDAGVPIETPVAGISIGLITSGDPHDGQKKIDKYKLITDILGVEDHFGDMDFKVAGSRSGITAMQLDVKLPGIPVEILCEGIHQAKDARMKILDRMNDVLSQSRESLKSNVPQVRVLNISVSKLRNLIGPGGSTIREIETTSGCDVKADNDGKISISGKSEESLNIALKLIQGKVFEFEKGNIYSVKCISLLDFGAIVQEIESGRSGFIHISEFKNERIEDLSEVIKVGDIVIAKCLDIGLQNGKNVRFSVKDARNSDTEVEGDSSNTRGKSNSLQANQKNRPRRVHDSPRKSTIKRKPARPHKNRSEA